MQPEVSFTIDGIEYSSGERKLAAGQLLALAGVNVGDHDLARVVGGEVQKRFEDSEIVQLVPGAKFVSIFTGPTPVV